MDVQSFLQWSAPFVVGFIGWAIKHWVFDLLKDRHTATDGRLTDVEKSLVAIQTSLDKPNGGSSVRDALNRIESGQTQLLKDIAHLKGRFDNHLEENKG